MSQSDHSNFKISTYVINLKERPDRLHHILKQFEDKPEFEINVIEAVKHKIGAVGLWKSILKAIKKAIENEDDVIIICEDDHKFTEHYSKEYLFASIIHAHEAGTNVLLGGIGGFENVIPISQNRWWVDSFWCTQFLVVYQKFFSTILDEAFGDTDTADGKLSEMTSNKMVMFPFISLQKDFGYSDVTKSNDLSSGEITRLFSSSTDRLMKIQKIHNEYYGVRN